MRNKKYFIKPLHAYKIRDEFAEEGRGLDEIRARMGYVSYSDYNYLRPGVVSYIKTLHFETALKLTREFFYSCNVIDFGCADGPFLPSLSKHFNKIVGIDKDKSRIEVASWLCRDSGLNNVRLLCNNDMTIKQLKLIFGGEKYNILYLLDIMEHIGSRENLYEEKMNFLEEICSLLENNGLIIISVPKMTGLSFLIQRFGLAFFDLHREKISTKDFLKAVFLEDTSGLETRWEGEHLGFNHKKMEEHIKRDFQIVKKQDIFFRIIYAIKKT